MGLSAIETADRYRDITFVVGSAKASLIKSKRAIEQGSSRNVDTDQEGLQVQCDQLLLDYI